MRRKSRSASRGDADGASDQRHAARAERRVVSAPQQTLPSAEDLQELKREIERLRAESERALAVVEEIYGETRPDMRLLPNRGK